MASDRIEVLTQVLEGVEAMIQRDSLIRKRAMSRDRNQYLRGRIEAVKDVRDSLRALIAEADEHEGE